MKLKNKATFFLFLYLIIILLWDLANPDALTQGTEGFYLQIAKEMSEKGSWLTPYYLNAPHWSKPPIHFWITMPFNILIKGHHLFISRLCMVLISLFSLSLLSKWLKKNFQINKSFTFFYFLSTLGFLKYSRIYMMEITLTSFNFISIIYLYDYLQNSRNKDLLIASFFMMCAVLVKGPISLVMVGLTIFFYFLLSQNFNKRYITKAIKFLTLSFILSSFWFIACYIKYGYSFIEYFFLRENMGKFSTKAYPVSSLFNGLILYGFPWSFLIPSSLFFYYKKFRIKKITSIEIFLSSAFLGYYLIWFIPSQKSYHYAIPALPYLLILILASISQFKSKLTSYKSLKKLNNMFHIWVTFFSLLLIILMIAGSIISFSDHSISIVRSIFSLIIALISIGYFIKTNDWYKKSICLFTFNSAVWIIFVPSFYLPLIPNDVSLFLKSKNVSTYYRKPYFIKESLPLSNSVKILNEGQIVPEVLRKQSYMILRKNTYERFNLQHKSKIIMQWDKWIRANPPLKIIKAIWKGDLSNLKEKMYIIF